MLCIIRTPMFPRIAARGWGKVKLQIHLKRHYPEVPEVVYAAINMHGITISLLFRAEQSNAKDKNVKKKQKIYVFSSSKKLCSHVLRFTTLPIHLLGQEKNKIKFFSSTLPNLLEQPSNWFWHIFGLLEVKHQTKTCASAIFGVFGPFGNYNHPVGPDQKILNRTFF